MSTVDNAVFKETLNSTTFIYNVTSYLYLYEFVSVDNLMIYDIKKFFRVMLAGKKYLCFNQTISFLRV